MGASAQKAKEHKLKHDSICPTKAAPLVEATMYPGSGLGLCLMCGALLPVASLSAAKAPHDVR